MQLSSISCFTTKLPLRSGSYTMSHGRVLEYLDSTVVEVVAENGLRGYGEVNTLASTYIEGFPGSVRAGVLELAPSLIGLDVEDGGVINARMDAVLLGHSGSKSALDAALWDLRGRLFGLPVVTLLGGAHRGDYPIYHPISLGSPESMADEAAYWAERGIRNWQLKVGNDPLEDAARLKAVLAAVPDRDFVTSDANRGWSMADAARFIRAIGDADTYIEQPCETIEQQAQLRSRTTAPFVIDEAVRTPRDLARAFALGAADAINIKPARVGGVTKAALIADLARDLGLKVVFDEPMGGEIAMAAIGHLSLRTDPEQLLATLHTSSTLLAEDSQPWLSGSRISVVDGRAAVPAGPGFGIEVDRAALGEAEFTVAA